MTAINTTTPVVVVSCELAALAIMRSLGSLGVPVYGVDGNPGSPGMRYALPNATIHLHQPLGGAQGQASDIEIAAREILRQRDLLNNILRKHTKMSDEEILRSTDRDYYMTPERAVELGVIDGVMTAPDKEPARLNGQKTPVALPASA